MSTKTLATKNSALPIPVPFLVVALILVGAGLVGIFLRFTQGLGATTNLSNAYPWGIWIGFDVVAGVALAASGFVAAFIAHIMQIERYHVHVRGGILAALLGYGFVGLSLTLDIGRPWTIWHPLAMPNGHSVMAEVAWCVALYLTVLALEFSPVVLRRFGMTGLVPLINRLYLLLVIAGVILSVLHQSSLGALFLISPTRMHPLWYSSLLPVTFLITAVATGLAMLIIEATFFTPDPNSPVRRRNIPQLGEYAGVLLLAYLGLRLADMWLHSRLDFSSGLESLAFLVEVGIGVLLPAILFLLPSIQRSPNGVFWAAWLVVLGTILNRYNVAVTSMTAHAGFVYVPSLWEIVITVGLIAAEVVIFIWIMKSWVLPDEELEHQQHKATA
jgi:Ni/Fe-hydrogenase subunit HybB-like protein